MDALLFLHKVHQHGDERWNCNAMKAAEFSSMEMMNNYGTMLEWYTGHKDIRYSF
jgi:hypothetical protein